ncbi:hypothetical protein QF042_000566 [Pedobacter sp. W3I1]|uniref:hypothetical protein n=1 Tax=Pedobacter sp. W3I1 TaxID=3042291 RepID=UPI002783A9C1|nr:hypothetical protein [Pedobacter sp. W3I1]MDQ0637001.1 hypothetical protein [Pedobacter sp. W3I1]
MALIFLAKETSIIDLIVLLQKKNFWVKINLGVLQKSKHLQTYINWNKEKL